MEKIYQKEKELVECIIDGLKQSEFKLKTVVKNINTKNTNVILGNKKYYHIW